MHRQRRSWTKILSLNEYSSREENTTISNSIHYCVERIISYSLLFTLIFTFLLFFLTTVLSRGISPIGNSGCFPRGKPAATESRFPTFCACWVFQCFFHQTNSDMDYGIFNVPTDVNACTRTRGRTDTLIESALKVDSGRKIPCRTAESNLRQRRAGPTLYHLSYIPSPSASPLPHPHP